MLSVDFETFGKVNLLNVGSFRYAEDQSTEPLCIAFANATDKVPTVVNLKENPRSPKLRPLFDAIRNGERLSAHNSHFERGILEEICGPRYGWPVPKPSQWKCTAAKASAAAYPRSLQNVAIALGLEVNKDPKGLGLINRFCKPQKNGSQIHWTDDQEGFGALMRYCQQDVVVEHAVDKRLPDLTPREEKVHQFDYLVNHRGIPMDVALAKRTLALTDGMLAALHDEAKLITGIKATQRDKLLDWLEAAGSNMMTLQAQEVEEELLDPDLDPRIRRILEIRIESSRAGMKKLGAILEGVSADGRIRGAFMYHAASTGRWGSTGVQFHNFAKGNLTTQELVIGLLQHPEAATLLPMFYDRPMTAVSQSMRGFLAASPEHDLLVQDYSAVEPCVLAWIADEKWLLEEYRGRGKAYEAMAAAIYNISIDAVTDDQRFFGKQVILGCGYQLGWKEFIAQCARFGITITEAFARMVIKRYRDSVPNIVQFWTDLERAALKCVHTGNTQTLAKGKVTFRMAGKILQMVLPSSRAISYPDAEILQVEKFGQMKHILHFSSAWKGQWVTEQTYGGKLTENLVQAISRDLLADGMLEAEQQGYPIIGHVHDEAQSEVALGYGDLAEFGRLLCQPLGWAKGIPLTVKGYRATRYHKE